MRFILKPTAIGTLKLKNRIVMPAINHSYSTDGAVPDRLVALYKRRAAGGSALITVGGCAVSPEGRSQNILCIYDDGFLPGLEKLAAAVHRAGGKIAAQLYHAGGYAKTQDIKEQAIAPSEQTSRYTNEPARAMSKEEIAAVVEKFAQAAARAQKAGFDAVELIASAGYLIAEFLSPFTNRRADEYGGGLENRAKFLTQAVRAVKGAAGKDYPVTVRLGGSDFVKGGNTSKEAVRIAEILEENGADALNVTGGWHESVIPQTTGELPGGGYNFLAKNIKLAVSIPVIASNRINTPEQAEFMIASGMADLVSLGRAHLADPDFAEKIASGRLEEIRTCIACGQGCYDRRFSGKDVLCMINYETGREGSVPGAPSPAPKKLLVAGGGVAGMEFAVRAGERGHKVTLWEKSAELGGQLHLAAVPLGKRDFKHLLSYQKAMLKKLGVTVCLNKEATKESVALFQPDAVILATGGESVPPPFPITMDKENVMAAGDVLTGKAMPGREVVIIGGGAVGCETAVYIADQATLSAEQVKFLIIHEAESFEEIKRLLNSSSRKVTIVEMQDKTGKDIGISTKWGVKKQIKRLGIKELTQTKVVGVSPDGVKAEAPDGKSSIIPADTVIIAAGAKARDKLAKELAGVVKDIYIIGDAKKPAKIMDAINDANELAAAI
ncbi:MAG: FAD-dependent oxidoreductase [Acidaminococcales bacterium]|jgi:2,4-dienoyl-CoA reductase (NADPH2)|nr:FAD-dependent oxidoreductase [Acidaminococcales bacterium]